MDKNKIKKFAIWARTELMTQVRNKMDYYEISANALPVIDIVQGNLLTDEEKKQRIALIEKVNQKGKDQVIEEVAYTWFNRFCALRYMEVNNYLPSRIRVFTDENNNFNPQILKEAIHLEFDELDLAKVYALKETNKTEALYKYLLITQCNELNKVLPRLFQKITDYTELLFPDNLLQEDKVIHRLITDIPQEDWKEAVQIIGWLYQFYNTERKEQIFADLKKNIKISKENMPAATQLYTPDWIVHYLVENSLGRLWVEGHPNTPIKNEWKYYLEEAEQESAVQARLEEIRKQYALLKPEEIKCIDPCAGSGHICVVLFDVLMQIYIDYGYNTRDAVKSIIENNLYGLDIDERATQLAYFAVMMKARQYDNRFLYRNNIPQPNIYAIQESNFLDKEAVDYFINNKELNKSFKKLIKDMYNATEYGSLVNITQVDFDILFKRINDISKDTNYYRSYILNIIVPFIQVSKILAQKYDIVVTNPPYLGNKSMNFTLSNYSKKYYSNSKIDIFAMFIERCLHFTKKNKFIAMLTQHSYMFLSKFKNFRLNILKYDFINSIHLGAKAFEEINGEVVQTVGFIYRNSNISNYITTFVKLIDEKTSNKKEEVFLSKNKRFYTKKEAFYLLPNLAFIYWLSSSFINNFKIGNKIEEFGEFTGSQNITANNKKYLRYFWEVNKNDIYKRWVPYAKGGQYRTYYGNLVYLVDWSEAARNFYHNNNSSNLLNHKYWYKEGITYTAVGETSFRYLPSGCIFDKGGPLICISSYKEEILALLNSKVAQYYFNAFNPSVNIQVNDIKNFPIILPKNDSIKVLANEMITIAKQDWNSFETSMNFCFHPLINKESTIEKSYNKWEKSQSNLLKYAYNNENLINKIFVELYKLTDEINISIDKNKLPVHKANLQRDIKSLISYAVGCMFGRYSLDSPGLIYAGGNWDDSKYKTFPIKKDGILVISDEEYFEDDIVNYFIQFIEIVYGKKTLDENLNFIANVLEGTGTPKDVIRNYFLNNFFDEHCKTYSVARSEKRPIYWLFDSGKENGFKCLIYMHRYRADTIAYIRINYLHELQNRYQIAIKDLKKQITKLKSENSEYYSLKNQLNKLNKQAEEARIYEEKIHHLADKMISIDLDEGVIHNYAIFQDVLAEIK